MTCFLCVLLGIAIPIVSLIGIALYQGKRGRT